MSDRNISSKQHFAFGILEDGKPHFSESCIFATRQQAEEEIASLTDDGREGTERYAVIELTYSTAPETKAECNCYPIAHVHAADCPAVGAPTTGAAIKQQMQRELESVPKQAGWHFWVMPENDSAEVQLCMMGPKLQAASFPVPNDSVRATVLQQFAADMRGAVKTNERRPNEDDYPVGSIAKDNTGCDV